MNKTININLAGLFFHIDEDAYLKLSHYLEAIKRSFTDSQGRSEIIADIEARIAELFTERIENHTQVVSTALVDEVITIMGQPEDYLVDEEIFEDESTYRSHTKSATKKLYRDTTNSYIGGVAAGFAHYFGIDAVWIRLLWLILAFGSAGTIIVFYLVCWALVPEAKTTAEKLMMTGDPVNISNIEKKIKDGFETVKEGLDHVTDNISETVKNVDFQKHGNSLKSNSQQFFDSLGSIALMLLKVFAKVIGAVLVVAGLGALLALIVAVFTIGITNAVHFPLMNFVDAANVANIPMWLMSTLVFFAFGIPFFFLFYLGLKILVNNLKSIGNVAKFTLLGVWLLAVVGLIITGVKQMSEHAFNAKTSVKNELNITANDTLNLKMVSYDNNNNFYRNHNLEIVEDDNGKYIISNNLRLIVRSTKNTNGYLVIEKEAHGSSYQNAKHRAKNIAYNYALEDNTLYLNTFLTTNLKQKFSQQNITLYLYLPEGTVLYANKNTNSFHQNYNTHNDILETGMEEHYLKITENAVQCLDCEDEDEDEDEDEAVNTEIKISKKEGTIDVKISEDNGVKVDF